MGGIQVSMEINIVNDSASPMLKELNALASNPKVIQRMANSCVNLTVSHISRLPANKQGWPSSGFWDGCARGTTSTVAGNSFTVSIDHPEKPGAMRQRFYGGTIKMKDKYLTIPARAEFYNQKATDFDNLKLAIFKSGAMALVIRTGGTGKVDFGTGRSKGVRGAGKKSAGMVAYWLKDSVDQEPNPDVIPTMEQYSDTCHNVLAGIVMQLKAGGVA